MGFAFIKCFKIYLKIGGLKCEIGDWVHFVFEGMTISLCREGVMSEKKTVIDAESEVTTTGLASILGLTGRRVQQLTQDGVLRTCKRGKYLLGDAVQRFISSKVDAAVTDEECEEAAKQKILSDARLKAAKADILEAEAEEVKGTMHRAGDVELLTNDMIYTIRSALNALPGRIAVDVAACETAAEASDLIRKEVHKIMRELAAYRYDPAKYEELVRERREWAETADDGEDE